MSSVSKEGKNANQDPTLQNFPDDGTGGFIKFQGENTLYNVYDAGNFMTGKAFSSIGVPLVDVLSGANISSVVTGNGRDTATDQNAIKNGWNYSLVGWKK